MLAPEFPSVTSLGPGSAVGKKAKKKISKCPFPVHRPAWFAHQVDFSLSFFFWWEWGVGGGGGEGGGRVVSPRLLPFPHPPNLETSHPRLSVTYN